MMLIVELCALLEEREREKTLAIGEQSEVIFSIRQNLPPILLVVCMTFDRAAPPAYDKL